MQSWIVILGYILLQWTKCCTRYYDRPNPSFQH